LALVGTNVAYRVGLRDAPEVEAYAQSGAVSTDMGPFEVLTFN
jgi:hypothetical protein